MPSHSEWRRTLQCAATLLMASLATGAAAEPFTLGQALDRAQTSSPQIIAAEAGVRAAEGRARQAGLPPNPEISFETENFSGTGPYGGFGASESTLAIGQTVELGGKRSARTAVARAELEAARLKLLATRADVARDIRVGFAEARAAEDRAALARESLDRAEDLARVVQTLVDAGREPPLRALRAKAAADAARADALTAEAEAEAARRLLAVVLGATEQTPTLVGDATEPARTMAVLDPAQSLDVRLAEAEADAARLSVRRERSSGVPDVTVSAGVRRFEDTGDQAWIVGVSAPIPVINRNQGSVAAARADADAAEARRLLALAEAIKTSRDAQAALKAADVRVQALEARTVPQAEEALRLVRLGYESGKFPLTEVLDAQEALSQAKQDLISARLDRARAAAALERAAAR